jgi:hypothetical protein
MRNETVACLASSPGAKPGSLKFVEVEVRMTLGSRKNMRLGRLGRFGALGVLLALCAGMTGCGLAAAPCRVASAGLKIVPLVGHVAAAPTDACANVIDP